MCLDVLNDISPPMSFFKAAALNKMDWRPLKLQLTPASCT